MSNFGVLNTEETRQWEEKRTANLNPAEGGWESEAFSARAESQLRRLAHWMIDTRGEEKDIEILDAIFAEDFEGGELVPGKLETVFDVDGLRVLRGKGGSSSKPEGADPEPTRGREGFLFAWRKLRSSMELEPPIKVSFKIFHVNQPSAASPPTTRQFISLRGGTPSGRSEQNATWLIRWAVSGKRTTPPRIRSIAVEDFAWVRSRSTSPGAPLLADATESILGSNASYHKQLNYGTNYWMERMEKHLSVFYFGHQGLSLGDVNGDGLEDLYVCQPGGLPNRLFVQREDGAAEDVSAEARVDLLDYTRSALFLDLDNDGDQDLVAGTLPQLLIFSNDGSGHFHLERRIEEAHSALSLSAADYDEDGDLDLYVCRYYSDASQEGRFALPLPYHDANNGGENFLLRNEGDLIFKDATVESGLGENNTRFSFAAAWEDYDNDGDMDLYVANDFGRNNLYRNEGGIFTDVAAAAGVEDISAGMSVTWGDYNRDGWMDLYVSNMFSTAGNRIAYQKQFQKDLKEETRALFQRHARGNSLFENQGNGHFRDISIISGTTMGRWAWGALFADLNGDGWEDLLCCNGYVTGKRLDDL